jgi:pimeloyl-ACP methyl ester carboxylesterase
MEGWGQPGQYDKMPKAGQDAIATALTHVARDFPWGSQWPEGQITEEDITRIDKPVLLGEGETTHNSAKVVNRELAKLFPKVESCVVKGAGHLSAVDDPKQVATLIRAHLENAEVAGY